MVAPRLVRESSRAFPTLGGAPRLLPSTERAPTAMLREHDPGRVAEAGVFRASQPVQGRARRLIVQVRTGVVLSMSWTTGSPAIHRGHVALAASWDPPGPGLAWVQTGRFDALRVAYADGTAGRANPPEPAHGFRDGNERWWVDSRSDSSARYSAGGVSSSVLGYQGGRVIYDLPDTTLAHASWLSAHPEARAVEVTVRFRTYLLDFRGGYHGLASESPLAAVDWWCTERFDRSGPNGAPRRAALPETDVLWILPNPIEPVALDDAIRAFRFR